MTDQIKEAPSWIEHIDLVQAAFILCLGYIGWSFNRMISKFEKSQALLFKMYGGMKTQLDTLQGEHNALVCKPHRRSTDHEED